MLALFGATLTRPANVLLHAGAGNGTEIGELSAPGGQLVIASLANALNEISRSPSRRVHPKMQRWFF